MWTNRWLAEQCTHFCMFRRSMDARLRLHANAGYSFTQGAVTLGPNRTLSRRGAAGVACTSMSVPFVLQPARINTKRDVSNFGMVFQLYLVFLVQARAKNHTEMWGWFWHLQVSYSRHRLLVRLVWYLHLRKHGSRQIKSIVVWRIITWSVPIYGRKTYILSLAAATPGATKHDGLNGTRFSNNLCGKHWKDAFWRKYMHVAYYVSLGEEFGNPNLLVQC